MKYNDYLSTGYLSDFHTDDKYELRLIPKKQKIKPKKHVLDYKRKLSLVLDENHIKSILSVVTDADGNRLNVDLYGIKYKDFLKLYFGEGTGYPRTSGKSLMAQYFLSKNEGRYKLLEVGGIKREDCADIKIDYKSTVVIKILLDIVTNSAGQKIQHNDFNVMGIREFNKLYFGYGTKYGKISGKDLIGKIGSFKEVLEFYGIFK